MDILIQWPTRGCPDGLQSRIEAWSRARSGRNFVGLHLVADRDDPDSVVACHEAQARFNDPNSELHLPTLVTVCEPGGKIAACNRLPPRTSHWNGKFDFPSTWDVVILASDDFVPKMSGWDEVIRRAMEWHFPAMDGMIHLPDAYSAYERFITLPIMGWNYYRRFGYIYHPTYQSLFCDREQTDVARALGKVVYVDLPVFAHEHRGIKPDETYMRNNTHWLKDQFAWERRTAEGFDLVTPDLSILIASMECRRPKSDKLLRGLYDQIFKLPDPNRVELRVLHDQRRWKIGAKRQMLLEQARGKYVCFIDDDDRVSDDYCRQLLAALDAAHEPPDCVVFEGRYSDAAVPGAAGIFDFDLKYPRYRTWLNERGVIYERTPNHLCPVKKELALRVGFLDQNCGEDSDYATRLRPLLKTQAVVPGNDPGSKSCLYWYDYDPAGTMTQRGRR